MNREVVKTDSATTRIPELDFEIPAFTQRGCEYYRIHEQETRIITVNTVRLNLASVTYIKAYTFFFLKECLLLFFSTLHH